MYDMLGQLRRHQEQRFRQRQRTEEQDRLRLQDTVPAIPQVNDSGDNALTREALLNPSEHRTIENIERILPTDIPAALRRDYQVELDLRQTEHPGRNVGASTTAGAEGNASTQSRLEPQVSSGRRRRRRPHRPVAESDFDMLDSSYQQAHVPQPYHPDRFNEDQLASRREQTSSRRTLRDYASQLPRLRPEMENPSLISRIPRATTAFGPIPQPFGAIQQPGLFQGITRSGTPITPPEDSAELVVVDPSSFSAGIRVQLPRQEDSRRRNSRFNPDTEPLAAEPLTAAHRYGNFSPSPPDLDILYQSLSPSPAPTANFDSMDPRENAMSAQRQTADLGIPRPTQEMRDFLRQTDPSPTTGDGGDSVSGAATHHEFSMASAGLSRTSSMETLHPLDFPLRTAESRATGGGGNSARSAAASHELRAPFLRAARNRRMPVTTVHIPSVQRQHTSQSPAQDVYMRDAPEAVVRGEAGGSVTDPYYLTFED